MDTSRGYDAGRVVAAAPGQDRRGTRTPLFIGNHAIPPLDYDVWD